MNGVLRWSFIRIMPQVHISKWDNLSLWSVCKCLHGITMHWCHGNNALIQWKHCINFKPPKRSVDWRAVHMTGMYSCNTVCFAWEFLSQLSHVCSLSANRSVFVHYWSKRTIFFDQSQQPWLISAIVSEVMDLSLRTMAFMHCYLLLCYIVICCFVTLLSAALLHCYLLLCYIAICCFVTLLSAALLHYQRLSFNAKDLVSALNCQRFCFIVAGLFIMPLGLFHCPAIAIFSAGITRLSSHRLACLAITAR